MDDITPLEQMTPEVMGQDATLFKPRDAVLWKQDRMNSTEVPGDKWWEGETAPRGTAIAYYLKSGASDVKVMITNTATGQEMLNCTGATGQGLNRFQWGLTGGGGRGGGGGFGAAAAAAAAARARRATHRPDRPSAVRAAAVVVVAAASDAAVAAACSRASTESR